MWVSRNGFDDRLSRSELEERLRNHEERIQKYLDHRLSVAENKVEKDLLDSLKDIHLALDKICNHLRRFNP